MKHLFEEQYLTHVIAEELRQRYSYSKTELRINLRKGEYSPPRRSMRIDFFGITETESLILEVKQLSDPPNVAFALGEAMMYRNIVRKKRIEIEQKHNIIITEPIKLGLCFPDFPRLYSFNKKDYGFRSWTPDTSILLSELINEISEEVLVFLVKSKVNNKNKTELEKKDLYVQEITDEINLIEGART